MSDFDPGLGWREVTEREWLSTPIDADHLELASHGTVRHWVREVPVPALPTTAYTVIRATWLPGGRGAVEETYALAYQGRWINVNTGVRHEPPELQAGITSFEVLSEPRAVTAKALIDRVRDTTLYELLVAANPENSSELDAIARDFGVEP